MEKKFDSFQSVLGPKIAYTVASLFDHSWMPASFPEFSDAPQFLKSLFFHKEALNQQAGQLVSC